MSDVTRILRLRWQEVWSSQRCWETCPWPGSSVGCWSSGRCTSTAPGTGGDRHQLSTWSQRRRRTVPKRYLQRKLCHEDEYLTATKMSAAGTTRPASGELSLWHAVCSRDTVTMHIYTTVKPDLFASLWLCGLIFLKGYGMDQIRYSWMISR